ncbi:putative P450 monooxygenase [Rhizodiscina lignyota]|uniref:P450 monooxygenase n=1 Tax=Rhizodiscina lignyota TaxID=1504668 RepID=A0A9P4MG85_9PEZI|nr:putative P450 monooxygenase [Rhizodiscina lignyota]
MMSYSILFLSLFVTLYFIHRARTYRALAQFGGPWSTGWSRLWLLRATASGIMQSYFKDVNDRFGSTARVGPEILITSDPLLIRRMSAVRSSYTRAKYYKALRLHPTRDNITTLRDEKAHDELRAKMAPGYSGKENQGLEATIDVRVRRLIALIKYSYVTTSTSYRPLDLARVVSFFTLDTISDVAFGKPFGFLDRDDDPFGYITQLKSMLPAMMSFSVYPEMQTIMQLPWMQLLLPKVTDAIGFGKVMGFARDVVAERFPLPGFDEPQVVRKDMLGSFKEHGLTQEQLESETLTQITAGSDSTATAIRMTLFHILTSPGSLNRLLNELDAAGFPSPSMSASDEGISIIPDSEARRLPYLQACIREGLRLYPPVTGLMSKQTPPSGDTIPVRYPDGTTKDVFVPGGVSIGWNTYGMLRSKHLFGDDAETWRPERWLDGNENQELIQAVDLVFGYGRFGCLGRSVAMLELNKAVPELARRFSWQVVNPEKPWGGICAGFWLQEDMGFVARERWADDGH